MNFITEFFNIFGVTFQPESATVGDYLFTLLSAIVIVCIISKIFDFIVGLFKPSPRI